MCSMYLWIYLLVAVTFHTNPVNCNPVTHSFNNNIREHAVKDENSNTTYIKTLQKEETKRYANFAPAENPVRFQEIPDNVLSSSSYSRGLLLHDHAGYGLHGYSEDPHHAHGTYEYHIPDDHGHGHGYGNHHDHYGGHHLGYGHHHKHNDHGLAAKAILWPIAGIALLGAAAALVSNPVLLQLGVISGKRRRRDTEEVTGPDFDLDRLPNNIAKVESNTKRRITKKNLRKTVDDSKKLAKPAKRHSGTVFDADKPNELDYNKYLDDDRFIPIPIKENRNLNN